MTPLTWRSDELTAVNLDSRQRWAYCVKATALEARAEGFETVLLEDACRGVDLPPGATAAAIEEMRQAGVLVRLSGDVA